ncbi:MAG TPA: hypothetical protein VEM58_13195 [Streptosporangiaceae bacterium]|nr:hypothetical protein [Streptosporangiaceae bacterium]
MAVPGCVVGAAGRRGGRPGGAAAPAGVAGPGGEPGGWEFADGSAGAGGIGVRDLAPSGPERA